MAGIDFAEKGFVFTAERVASAIDYIRPLKKSREWRDLHEDGQQLVLRVGPQRAVYYRRGRDAATGQKVAQKIGPAAGLGALTVVEARRACNRLRQGQAATGAPRPVSVGRIKPAGVTVADAVAGYLKAAASGGFTMRTNRGLAPLKGKTLQCRASVFRKHLLADHGSKDVAWLADAAGEMYLAFGTGDTHEDGKKQPALANQFRAACRAVFEYLIVIEKWRGENPIGGRKFQRFAVAKREVNLSDDETSRFIAAARADNGGRWLNLAIVLIGSGQRLGNVCGLRWQQVDMRSQLIHYGSAERKNADADTVGMSEDIYSILKGLHSERKSPYVFCSEDDQEKPVPVSSASRALSRIAKAAAVATTGHGFRHCFGSWAEEAGVPETSIAAAGGWKHTSSLARYRHGQNPVKAAPAVRAVSTRLGNAIALSQVAPSEITTTPKRKAK
jgi:integrase